MPDPREQVQESAMEPRSAVRGRLVGYMGVVWIEGDGWQTEPGWMGPLKAWKARRFAKRNRIVLMNDCQPRCRCGAALVDDGDGWMACERGHYERTPESRTEMAKVAKSHREKPGQ